MENEPRKLTSKQRSKKRRKWKNQRRIFAERKKAARAARNVEMAAAAAAAAPPEPEAAAPPEVELEPAPELRNEEILEEEAVQKDVHQGPLKKRVGFRVEVEEFVIPSRATQSEEEETEEVKDDVETEEFHIPSGESQCQEEEKEEVEEDVVPKKKFNFRKVKRVKISEETSTVSGWYDVNLWGGARKSPPEEDEPYVDSHQPTEKKSSMRTRSMRKAKQTQIISYVNQPSNIPTPSFIKVADVYHTPGMLDFLKNLRDAPPAKSKWKKAQGISYFQNRGGLFSVKNKDQTYRLLAKELLYSVGKVIDDTEIGKWAHYYTYLQAPRLPKPEGEEEYYQSIQQPHKDFKDKDLKGHDGKFFICFIPLTQYGMKLAIYEGKFGKVYDFDYGKLYVIPANTVHAGGFCNDAYGGNLRLQLHITTDSKNHPLPIDGLQQKILQHHDFQLDLLPVSLNK